MKRKEIELANISRFRGELMGLAILFVMLFHVGVPRTDMFFGLRRMGNIGVDMFFFLSGVGLWYSWTKNADTMQFLRKRLLRIYPAWLIVASLYYIPDFLSLAWVQHSGHSTNIIDLIGDIAINWDFWLHDELTFWYIPAAMMLYLVTPAYLSLIIKHPTYRWIPALMIAWCVVVQYVSPIHEAVGHIEIFWSRVPIYFIGLNFGAAVKEKRTLAHTIDVCRYACSLYLFGTGTTRTLSAILGTYVVYSAHHNRHIAALHCIRQVVRQTPAQGSYIRGQHKFRDILAAQPFHTYLYRTAWVALLGKVPCNACNSFTLRMASTQRSGEDNNENRKELGK